MLSIDHPRVQAAKYKFEHPKRGRKNSFNFDELFQKFSDRDLSFRQIARDLETSPQVIHQLFEAHFSKLMPLSMRSSKKRREARKKQETSKRIKELKQLRDDSPAKIITRIAKIKRFSCDRILAKKELLKRYVKIGDKLGYALVSRSSRKYHQQTIRRYHHFPISKSAIQNVEYVFLITKSFEREDVYIFHVSELLEFTKPIKHYYIPDVTTPLKSRPRKTPLLLDFNAHLNVWEKVQTPRNNKRGILFSQITI